MKKFLFLIFITVSLLNASSFSKGMSFFIKGKYHKAIPHFVKASNAGNKQAQFYLANMYEKGLGVKKDKKMASKLYKIYTSKSTTNTSITAKSKPKTKLVKKQRVKKTTKKTKESSYSRKYKKNYNPNLQGAKEVVFN